MRTFPEWWSWDLSFTGHAELRMEQRGVTEVEVRAKGRGRSVVVAITTYQGSRGPPAEWAPPVRRDHLPAMTRRADAQGDADERLRAVTIVG